MTHPDYKLIEDCDIDGTHISTPRECKICGTIFCKDCAGVDINGNGNGHSTCPGCGYDTQAFIPHKKLDIVTNVCTECNGEEGYHDYPERECPGCGTLFTIACCGGKLFCLSRTKVSTLQNKSEVYDKESTVCPTCGYPKCDIYVPKDRFEEDPDDVEIHEDSLFDVLTEGEVDDDDEEDEIVRDIFLEDEDDIDPDKRYFEDEDD